MSRSLPRFLSSLIVPLIVLIVLPYWLRTTFAAVDTHWGEQWIAWPARALGVALVFVGAMLFGWCVYLFTKAGRGTIMPWNPTQQLVVLGPYRHVRNPMISGVVFMVAGQALWWGSWITAALAAFFFGFNHFYFIFSEEPGLEKRFGESYRLYKANVPRWIPRLRPWLGLDPG